jgi:hypothetical protein
VQYARLPGVRKLPSLVTQFRRYDFPTMPRQIERTATVNPPVRAAAHRWLLAFLVALVAFAGSITAPSRLVGQAHADAGPCAAQQAAVDADNRAIDEHNSRQAPGGVAPPEIAIPYNQEAQALDARAQADDARLQACRSASRRLASGGSVQTLPDRARNTFEQVRRAAPPGWRAPDPLQRAGNNNVIVPKDSPVRPIMDMRQGGVRMPQSPYPDVPLQGRPRPNVGDPNPAMPGQVIGKKPDGEPAVSADHIVPVAELIQLPRFTELNPDNMWRVLNAPMNLQWLPTTVNLMKGSRSTSDVGGVDPAWRATQEELQRQKRQELTEIIAQLADSQLD